MPKIISTVFIVVVVVVDVRPVLRPLPDGVHEDVERADAVIGVAHLANVVVVVDVGDDKSFFLRLKLELESSRAGLTAAEPASAAAVDAIRLKFAETFWKETKRKRKKKEEGRKKVETETILFFLTDHHDSKRKKILSMHVEFPGNPKENKMFLEL